MPREAGLNQPVLSAEILKAAPHVLSTPSLSLRRPSPDDAAAVVAFINGSLPTLRFIEWGQQPVDVVWAAGFCRRAADFSLRAEALVFHAFGHDGGPMVAAYDLHTFDLDSGRCQLGYVGAAWSTGRGLVREGALAMIDLAFGLGVHRVEAWCDSRNARSIQFARGLGLQREGVLRQVERDPQGHWCDQVLLARLASDPAPPPRP